MSRVKIFAKLLSVNDVFNKTQQINSTWYILFSSKVFYVLSCHQSRHLSMNVNDAVNKKAVTVMIHDMSNQEYER